MRQFIAEDGGRTAFDDTKGTDYFPNNPQIEESFLKIMNQEKSVYSSFSRRYSSRTPGTFVASMKEKVPKGSEKTKKVSLPGYLSRKSTLTK
jgi:hypothetical protein